MAQRKTRKTLKIVSRRKGKYWVVVVSGKVIYGQEQKNLDYRSCLAFASGYTGLPLIDAFRDSGYRDHRFHFTFTN